MTKEEGKTSVSPPHIGLTFRKIRAVRERHCASLGAEGTSRLSTEFWPAITHLINKEQWVAGVDYPGIRTTSAIVDDLRIRVYGDAAVVTGRAVYRGRSKKSGEFVHRFRFTDTFIRRDSAWKCVASHASGLPPK